MVKVFILSALTLKSGLRKMNKNEGGRGQKIIIFNLKVWNEQHELEITELFFHSLIKEQKEAATESLLQKSLL